MLNQSPSFASVARKIGEPRLEWVLQELADDVRRQISFAGSVPLRSDVRKDVKQLRANAERFEKVLNRISKRLLDLPFPRGLAFLPRTRQSIRKLIEWSDTIGHFCKGRSAKPSRQNYLRNDRDRSMDLRKEQSTSLLTIQRFMKSATSIGELADTHQ